MKTRHRTPIAHVDLASPRRQRHAEKRECSLPLSLGSQHYLHRWSDPAPTIAEHDYCMDTGPEIAPNQPWPMAFARSATRKTVQRKQILMGQARIESELRPATRLRPRDWAWLNPSALAGCPFKVGRPLP